MKNRQAVEIAEQERIRKALSVRRIVKILYTVYPNPVRTQRAASWLLLSLGCLPYHLNH